MRSTPSPVPAAAPPRALLPSMYFLTFLGLSAVIPYLALYFDAIGFSGAQIGVLLGVGPLISLFSTPLWTGFSDATRRHNLVLGGAIAAAIAIYALIPFVRSFALMVAAFVSLAFFASHLLSLTDSATIHMLGEFKDRYGRVRFWGTVGWGLGAPLFGWLFNYTGLVWMFWFASLLLLVPLLLVHRLRFDRDLQHGAFLAHLRRLVSEPRLLLFLFATVLGAGGQIAHGSYLSLRLNELEQAGATLFGLAMPAASLLGLALLLSMLSEFPVMLYSERLLKQLGTRGLLFISLLVTGGRNLLYAANDQLWAVLAIQALHGLTYAFLWIAGVHFMARNAPSGLSATAQGLFNAALAGVGYAVGNLVCGMLIDSQGVQGMFAISGLAMLAGFGLVALLDRRYRIF